MSLNSQPPGRRSVATTSSDTAFFKTRPVLRKVRKISLVSRSLALTRAALMLSWIGASLVAQHRVPMLTPSAPSTRAAAKIGRAHVALQSLLRIAYAVLFCKQMLKTLADTQ